MHDLADFAYPERSARFSAPVLLEHLVANLAPPSSLGGAPATVWGTGTKPVGRPTRIGSSVTEMVAAKRLVWATAYGENRLVRFGTRRGRRIVDRYTVPHLDPSLTWGASGLAASDGSVWVVNTDDATISSVDASGRILLSAVRLAPPSSGREAVPAALSTGDSRLWVVDGFSGTITRLSLETLQPTGALIVIGGNSRLNALDRVSITATATTAWVLEGDTGVLHRIGPSGDAVKFGVRPGIGELDAGAGSLWVTNSHAGTVTRMNLRTGRVMGTIHTGGAPLAIDAQGDAVWVTDIWRGLLLRIDPETDEVVEQLRACSAPRAVVARGAFVWVGDRATGLVTRYAVGEPGVL